jgi:hypothetical protein
LGGGSWGFWLFGRHRNQRADGPIVFRQELAGDSLYIFCRYRADALYKLVDFPPPRSNGFSLPD